MSEQLGPGTPVPDQLVLDVRIADRGDGSVLLTVAGEVDTLSTPVLRRALDTAWAGRPDRLLVDLSAVTFLNASGLRTLHRAAAQAAAYRASLQLYAAPGLVSQSLDWVGLPHSTAARADATSRRRGPAGLHAVPDIGPAPLPDAGVRRRVPAGGDATPPSLADPAGAAPRRLGGLFAGVPGPAQVAASWDRRLRRAAAAREVVGQATGILMERHLMTAEEAHRWLDAVSRLREVPVPEVAEKLARTGEW
ncbi:ANTAR domain-containing protein [Modestobacter altitudinis]|uniref:ANTAR domain-containing protein n=1 Tax=Modestobacter altitudinis TaxID=2213158 RepID=UPI00110CE227|nr:ANTAR domain-containing protein [Modestobacter altitudinis]